MYKIAVLRGDGIGPEVVDQALKVIRKIGEVFHLVFEIREAAVGGDSIDQHGVALTEEAIVIAKNSDAVLLGAVGGPRWDGMEILLRPESALLGLRSRLEVFANLRPVKIFPGLAARSTLKEEVVRDLDFVIVRELTGGIYFGLPRGYEKFPDGTERAFNTEVYTTAQVERIARKAFDLARRRRKKVTCVDKSNVLESSQLWRKVVFDVGRNYRDVNLECRYVDDCAMQILRNPKQFDVIVTTNMFGDILSDEAAMLTGSIGMLPSASLGERHALYEPIHGSAPDIAGKDVANPLATILSVAMMMEHSFNLLELAQKIESAVWKTLSDGYRTADIEQEGMIQIGCSRMGDLVAERIQN